MEGEGRVVAGATASEGRLDRLARAREDGEDAIAEQLAFDGSAVVLANGGAERRIQLARLRPESRVAEAPVRSTMSAKRMAVMPDGCATFL